MSDLYHDGHHNKFGNYKCFAINCARDLRYPAIVIEKLRAARSDSDIARIMNDARNGVY